MTGFRKILVPLDGSELAEHAVEVARQVAGLDGAELVLVRVLTTPRASILAAPPGMVVAVDNRAVLERERESAEEAMLSLARGLNAAGLRVDYSVLEGPVEETILDVAEKSGADLIVLSSHGRSGIRRWAYGSVAERVLRHAACPVLVLRPKQDG